MSFPLPVAPSECRHSFKGLYDVCLTLSVAQRVVGNDVNADDKDLVIITGANQGGNSTFLRSIGLAQLSAMVAARYNPQLKNFCDKFIAAGKPKLVALVAVARKLITILKRCETDAHSSHSPLDQQDSRFSLPTR